MIKLHKTKHARTAGYKGNEGNLDEIGGLHVCQFLGCDIALQLYEVLTTEETR